ncbi:uncharacterized protein LOC110888593 [Helianthus annuus]|uniref:uncharacterized protein LOC110888593 n=1 Tax=Helianthus annuus TaxID=4232 RepID=UPI0016533B82|nr:uncharacterized protein LOC110888593 [Helianthus annuus]
MKAIQEQDQGLYDWLTKTPLKHWSRAYFRGRAKSGVLFNNLCEVFSRQLAGGSDKCRGKSDVLLKNLCEVFNRQLVRGRDKPIITCLELSREYLMKRIVNVQKEIDKWSSLLMPGSVEEFQIIKTNASNYTVMFSRQNKYQVSGGPGLEQRVVHVGHKTCSCRGWELNVMPCKHAVAVIWDMNAQGIHAGYPEAWVDPVSSLDSWKSIYTYTIGPINGREMWTPSTCPTTLTPPKHLTQVRRPNKKRKKSAI